MEFLKGLIRKQTWQRIGSGVLDSIPVVSTVKTNIESSHNGEGNFDWLRFTVCLISVGCIIAIITGKLTVDQAKEILQLFK